MIKDSAMGVCWVGDELVKGSVFICLRVLGVNEMYVEITNKKELTWRNNLFISDIILIYYNTW